MTLKKNLIIVIDEPNEGTMVFLREDVDDDLIDSIASMSGKDAVSTMTEQLRADRPFWNNDDMENVRFVHIPVARWDRRKK